MVSCAIPGREAAPAFPFWRTPLGKNCPLEHTGYWGAGGGFQRKAPPSISSPTAGLQHTQNAAACSLNGLRACLQVLWHYSPLKGGVCDPSPWTWANDRPGRDGSFQDEVALLWGKQTTVGLLSTHNHMLARSQIGANMFTREHMSIKYLSHTLTDS